MMNRGGLGILTDGHGLNFFSNHNLWNIISFSLIKASQLVPHHDFKNGLTKAKTKWFISRQAKSKYILLLDADFVPSPEFQTSFQSSIDQMEKQPMMDQTAFIVPVFEYSQEVIKVCKEDFLEDLG